MALPLVLGCGATELIPPVRPDAEDLLWDLELDHHAVALALAATYDRLQVTATPRNFRGEALEGLPAPRYRSTDPAVIATAEGVLIARARTSMPVAVEVALTYNNITRKDTAMVNVVDASVPPLLTSLSIQPVAPDSAKLAVQSPMMIAVFGDTLFARALNSTGATIPTYQGGNAGVLPLYFRSADTTVIIVDRNGGEVRAVSAGRTTIYASTNAFGIARADTLTYRAGWPVFVRLYLQGQAGMPVLIPPVVSDITIGSGGVVVWIAFSTSGGWVESDAVDLIFMDDKVDDVWPAAPLVEQITKVIAKEGVCDDCTLGGNVTIDSNFGAAARQFPVPGIYEYRGGRRAAGLYHRIVVAEER